MSNYVVTSDSTCDLSQEQIEKNGIVLKPLAIILGNEEHFDGVDINAKKVLEYVDKNGVLPKTAATSQEQYYEYFKQFVDEGKQVLHFNISSGASSCFNNALKASKQFEEGKVFVVDSKQLSSGQGLLVLKACDLLFSGKTVKETYEYVDSISEKVQTSFIVDRLDFLHKGGRCSLAQLIGAKVFRFHPYLAMEGGSLRVVKKYQGNMKRCFESYVKDIAMNYPKYDDTRCFITHCEANQEYIDTVESLVKTLFNFKEVIISTAGATVTSHCGRNTMGILFITE